MRAAAPVRRCCSRFSFAAVRGRHPSAAPVRRAVSARSVLPRISRERSLSLSLSLALSRQSRFRRSLPPRTSRPDPRLPRDFEPPRNQVCSSELTDRSRSVVWRMQPEYGLRFGEYGANTHYSCTTTVRIQSVVRRERPVARGIARRIRSYYRLSSGILRRGETCGSGVRSLKRAEILLTSPPTLVWNAVSSPVSSFITTCARARRAPSRASCRTHRRPRCAGERVRLRRRADRFPARVRIARG